MNDRTLKHVEMEEDNGFGRRSCDEHVDKGRRNFVCSAFCGQLRHRDSKYASSTPYVASKLWYEPWTRNHKALEMKRVDC